jgi:uncharacterized protein YrzB (UPF0473 family)
MENLTFKIRNKDGILTTYETIATYEDESTKKSYIIYTDGIFDKNGQLKVYSSLYTNIDNNMKLYPVESVQDKKVVNEIIRKIIIDIKAQN